MVGFPKPEVSRHFKTKMISFDLDDLGAPPF